MYTGHLIEGLIQTVARAEEHAHMVAAPPAIEEWRMQFTVPPALLREAQQMEALVGAA